MTPELGQGEQPGPGRRRLVRRQVASVAWEINPVGFVVYLAVMGLGVYAVLAFGHIRSATHWWAGFAGPAAGEVVAGLALLVLSMVVHPLDGRQPAG